MVRRSSSFDAVAQKSGTDMAPDPKREFAPCRNQLSHGRRAQSSAPHVAACCASRSNSRWMSQFVSDASGFEGGEALSSSGGQEEGTTRLSVLPASTGRNDSSNVRNIYVNVFYTLPATHSVPPPGFDNKRSHACRRLALP
jgi:hypothetical protein